MAFLTESRIDRSVAAAVLLLLELVEVRHRRRHGETSEPARRLRTACEKRSGGRPTECRGTGSSRGGQSAPGRAVRLPRPAGRANRRLPIGYKSVSLASTAHRRMLQRRKLRQGNVLEENCRIFTPDSHVFRE